jgi:hypothetical protein
MHNEFIRSKIATDWDGRHSDEFSMMVHQLKQEKFGNFSSQKYDFNIQSSPYFLGLVPKTFLYAKLKLRSKGW